MEGKFPVFLILVSRREKINPTSLGQEVQLHSVPPPAPPKQPGHLLALKTVGEMLLLDLNS